MARQRVCATQWDVTAGSLHLSRRSGLLWIIAVSLNRYCRDIRYLPPFSRVASHFKIASIYLTIVTVHEYSQVL
jgi:hypothetical protein